MDVVSVVTLGVSIMTLGVLIATEFYKFLLRQYERNKAKRELRLIKLRDEKRQLDAKIKSHKEIVSQITDENIKATFKAVIAQAEAEVEAVNSEILKLEETFQTKGKEVNKK